MSGRRVGGKPVPEYNIVLLGDLGVGKSGKLNVKDHYSYHRDTLLFNLEFVYNIVNYKHVESNWLTRGGGS
jgi:hypothetical protein